MKENDRLTILGSGVLAHGIEFQTDIRYPPGYLLERDGLRILLDISEGVDIRLTRMGVDYSALDTIFISHFHTDHFQAPNFVFSSILRRHHEGTLPYKVKIIGPRSLEEKFWTIFKAHMDRRSLPGDSEIEFVELEDMQEARLVGAVLRAYEVRHDAGRVPAISSRMEFADGLVFSYSGDTGECKGIYKSSQNADYFLCEISSSIGEDKNEYGHLTPYQAGKIAKQGNVKNLLLTHYWGKDSEEAIIGDAKRSGFKGSIEVVKDFQKIGL